MIKISHWYTSYIYLLKRTVHLAVQTIVAVSFLRANNQVTDSRCWSVVKTQLPTLAVPYRNVRASLFDYALLTQVSLLHDNENVRCEMKDKTFQLTSCKHTHTRRSLLMSKVKVKVWTLAIAPLT